MQETNTPNDIQDRNKHFVRPTFERPPSLVSFSLLAIILGLLAGLGGYLIGKTWLPANLSFLNSQPEIKISLEQPLVDMATKNLESVAGIYRPVKVNALLGQPLFAASDLLGQAAVITSDGWLMTSDQVLVDKQSLVVLGSEIYNIKDIKTDKFSGVIFIKVAASGLVPVNFQFTNEFKKGETAFTILDTPNNIDNTFASNVLSQAHYVKDNVLSTDVMDYYLLLDKEQVVLGAPYFNTKGDLLGLGHVVANEPVLIPVEYLRQAVRHLLDNTQRVVWGISYLDLENNSGILSSGNIVNLPPAKNSLAAKAGLLAGDRITAVNNDTVSKDRSLTSILQNYRSGDKVVLKVLRSGVEMDIEIK